MNFPYLSGAGLYRSEVSEFKKLKMTPPRTVREYEIELFCEQYQYGIVDGVQVPYRKGTVLIAKPGNVRCSRLRFSCYYLHVTVPDESMRRALDGLPISLHVSEADEETLIGLFRRIAALFPESGDRAPFETTGLLMLLIAQLQRLHRMTDTAERSVPQLGREVAATARVMINEHYMQALTLGTLAESVHLNPNYFHKLFTSACGVTPLQYLTDVRISHARYYLRNTDRSITEIAELCGFNSYSYFCTVFRKRCGLSPSAFRSRANQNYDGIGVDG